MIIVTTEQKQLLSGYLKTLEALIQSDDVNELLFELDDLILEIGLDKDQEINSLGIKLQRAYDQIYNQNVEDLSKI